MKELEKESGGSRVCMGKHNVTIEFFYNSSSHGGTSPDYSPCPFSLVPYGEFDEEMIVSTPILIMKLGRCVYSTVEKVG